MKVGIMSMQRIENYGSFLQAYGLKLTIEAMGHCVEFVDYLPGQPITPRNSMSSISMARKKVRNMLKMVSPSYREYRKKQIRMNQSCDVFFKTYQKVFLQLLGVGETRNYCPELDVLVIGSDEVFNCIQSNEMVGYSLQLFGSDHRAQKLISYAASFGSTTLENLENYNVADEIGTYLKAFDSISVRDSNSVQIIQKLCGETPAQHIDPVLLYDFPEVAEINVMMRDYMVVYAYAGRIRDVEANAICAFARKYNKKILCLGICQPFCDEYILASPLEVLAYIKHADYVVTDTFHGTVFSIKYQTPFATIVRDSNQQKLSDLLCRFDLESRRLLQMNELEGVLRAPIDRVSVRELLSNYQKEAKAYLDEALRVV